MQPYIKTYMAFFGLGEQDIIYDEIEWVSNRNLLRAADVHHIYGRGKGRDVIGNLIALSRDHHDNVNSVIMTKSYLTKVHDSFMKNNPYI